MRQAAQLTRCFRTANDQFIADLLHSRHGGCAFFRPSALGPGAHPSSQRDLSSAGFDIDATRIELSIASQGVLDHVLDALEAPRRGTSKCEGIDDADHALELSHRFFSLRTLLIRGDCTLERDDPLSHDGANRLPKKVALDV